MTRDGYHRPPHVPPEGEFWPGWSRLTPREHEVILLHFAGLSRKEIAAKWGLAANTVKMHFFTAREKLGIDGDGASAWLPVAVAYGAQHERERRRREATTARGIVEQE